MAVSTELWRRWVAFDAGDMPEHVWRWASLCVLDWTGCAIRGSEQPISLLLRAEYADREGPAALVGAERATADVPTAALINGAASHALDFDDSNGTGLGYHPAAPAVPAALAIAQARHASGADFLRAVVAGYEFSHRVGVALGGPAVFVKGWHPTKLLGVFGSLAAAASLMGLTEEEFGNPFGIAASLSSGSQATFGTMTKPLHPGLAAQAGITAARLGRRGITANPEALEAMGGLAELVGDGVVHRDDVADYDGQWVIDRTIFKAHAACLGTHASIDAALAAAEGLGPAGIERVTVRIHPATFRVCRFDVPETGYQAKFSVRAATTLALLRENTGDPELYGDDRVHSADFLDLVSRVDVEGDPGLRRRNSDVEITTTDGRTLRAHGDSTIPQTDLELLELRLRAKFHALAAPVIGEHRADALADRLLETRSVEDVAALVP